MFVKKIASLAALALIFTMAANALAQNLAPTPAKTPFLWIDAGVKGGPGGQYVNKPKDVAGWQDALPFADGAGGFGGAFMMYTEIRVLKEYLGLEIDFSFDKSTNWCNVDYGSQDADFKIESTAFRVPIMLKGIIPTGNIRLSLGTGPEIVKQFKTSTSISNTLVENAFPSFNAIQQKNVFWTFDFGIAIEVWKLAITIDLRYSHNLNQEKNFDQRVQFSGTGTGDTFTATQYNVDASNTLDGRILLGVAYGFEIAK